MITLKNITLKNFLSVGQITQAINLQSSGMTLVLGKNSDIGAANSRNGVGKSSLLQAISFALFGEPLTNIRLGNLINNINQKNMMVTIDFSRDGVDYRIERGRSPNVLKFFVNNKEMKSEKPDSTDESNQTIGEDKAQGQNKHTLMEIERIIGMSHTMFKHIVALNTFTTPFLKSKPAEQREVIEELLGITQLSQRDEILTKLIKETKDFIKEQEANVNAITEANSRINKAIDKAKEEQNTWNVSQQVKINKISEEIGKILDIDFDAEIAIFDAIEQWEESSREYATERTLYVSETESINKEARNLTKEINKAKEGSNNGLEAQINRLQAEARRCEDEAKKTADSQITRLQTDAARRLKDAEAKDLLAASKQKELENVLTEIENSDGHTCATCGQGLQGTDHLVKVQTKLEAKAMQISSEIEKYKDEAANLRKDANEVYEEIDQVKKAHVEKQKEWVEKGAAVRLEISNLQSEIDKKKKEVQQVVADLEKSLAEIQELMDERADGLKKIDEAIVKLGKKPVSSYKNREDVWKLREYKDKLVADLEREIAKENPHDQNIASLQSTIQEINYKPLNDAQTELKHQDFLHKLLSGKDSFIRKKIVDQNLNYLNVRMNKYLEALGLPHEVKFLPDLTVDITMLGREFDFEQLSRGEMNRVILATSWSFRDVWESMNTGLNLLTVDELIDSGLDGDGSESALEVMNKMARERGKNIFLISHRENLVGRVNHVLMVHKENQFTRFEEDAEIS